MSAAPDTPPRPRATLRTLIHLPWVVGGWIGFVWLWLLVAAQPWESQRLLWLIVASTLILPLLTGAWVVHNRSIHRRKGERRAVAPANTAYTHDWHGRSVQADWAQLQASRFVMISIDGECKVYRGTTPLFTPAADRGGGGRGGRSDRLTGARSPQATIAQVAVAQVANEHGPARAALKAGAGHER